MEYRIEKRVSFTLLAKVEAYDNAVASNDSNEIPKFWKRCGCLIILQKECSLPKFNMIIYTL